MKRTWKEIEACASFQGNTVHVIGTLCIYLKISCYYHVVCNYIKCAGSEDANLLISTDNKVLQAGLEGSSIQTIGMEERTKESNGL